jgi:excinuclease ABC subunit C
MGLFETKLGKEFLTTVPTSPGIYRIFNEQSQLIYVGKAKNLKRRLSQYKNAKRRKKHRKMRKIVQEATEIQFEVCQSEYDAEIFEAQLIQTHRPKWNVVGAFYFLYPLIGLRWESDQFYICYTTEPEKFSDFQFFGSYRSREITGQAFFSFNQILRIVGHPIPKSKIKFKEIPKFSYVYGFRRISEEWKDSFHSFFKGESRDLLESLVLALVENAGARKKPGEIQEALNFLNRFWKHEASLLAKVIRGTEYSEYPVSQKSRDLLFVKFRHHKALSQNLQQQ